MQALLDNNKEEFQKFNLCININTNTSNNDIDIFDKWYQNI